MDRPKNIGIICHFNGTRTDASNLQTDIRTLLDWIAHLEAENARLVDRLDVFEAKLTRAGIYLDENLKYQLVDDLKDAVRAGLDEHQIG